MTDICHQCGESYEVIGSHWSRNSECSYPRLTKRQREVTTGLVMGDGFVNGGNDKNPRLESGMTNKEYLEYVDNIFGVLGHGVKLRTTAEENARLKRESGFSLNANSRDYSDIYRWQSMRHPEFQEFVEWYDSGKKTWPSEIKLTPIVLKHWYCGDGNRDSSRYNDNIRISMWNERKNTEKVSEMFERVGLEPPSNYYIRENNCTAQFTVEQSERLWEYMGEPLPGFEYKWPQKYRKV